MQHFALFLLYLGAGVAGSATFALSSKDHFFLALPILFAGGTISAVGHKLFDRLEKKDSLK